MAIPTVRNEKVANAPPTAIEPPRIERAKFKAHGQNEKWKMKNDVWKIR
jgi:hypothetical protein